MAARGNQFRMAQRVCLGCPKQISNRGLSYRAKKLEDENYWMGVDGETHVRRTVKNLPDDKWTMAPFYYNYKDWKERGEYFTEEQWESPLQLMLMRNAQQKTGSQFFDISEQDTLDFSQVCPPVTYFLTPFKMPLEPIDFEKDILDDFTVLLIGRRRSGKTWASRWMAYHLRWRYPFAVVITGTKLNNFWSSYVPVEFIYDIEQINEVIDILFARQTYLISNPQLGVDPRMMLILDDVMGDQYTIRFSEQLNSVFTNGRHFKMFIMITMQDPKGVGPTLRENTDCAYIFRVYEGGRKEVIYKEWLSYFHSNDHVHKEMVSDFFWNNTGFIEEDTGEAFTEDHADDEADLEGVIPQSVIVLQGRTTNDLQKVFKKNVSEDPKEFYLGRKDYYEAALEGEYDRIRGTSPVFRKLKGGPANPDVKDEDAPEMFNAREAPSSKGFGGGSHGGGRQGGGSDGHRHLPEEGSGDDSGSDDDGDNNNRPRPQRRQQRRNARGKDDLIGDEADALERVPREGQTRKEKRQTREEVNKTLRSKRKAAKGLLHGTVRYKPRPLNRPGRK